MALVAPALGACALVADDVHGAAEALRHDGLDVAVYAPGGRARGGDACALDALLVGRVGADLSLLWPAAGADGGAAILARLPGVRVVRWCDAGTAGVRSSWVADRSIARVLASSAAGAAALAAGGADAGRIVVVPAFDAVPERLDLAPDERALARWLARGPAALLVAPLVPGGGQRRAMRAIAAYAELYGAPIGLRCVGAGGPARRAWLDVLARERSRLGLDRAVELVGALDEAELVAAHLSAHLLLRFPRDSARSRSAHHAAALGVPMLTVTGPRSGEPACADLHGSLGADGLVLRGPSDDDLAVAIRRLLEEVRLRERVIEAQRGGLARRTGRDGAALRSALRGLG